MVFKRTTTPRDKTPATTTIGLTENDLAQRIVGNAGANRVEGGGGADSLIGGAGADSFVFWSATDSTLDIHDTIRDFSHAQGDVIDLSGIVTDVGDPFQFVEGTARFSGTAGERIVTQRGTLATVQGDLDGD